MEPLNCKEIQEVLVRGALSDVSEAFFENLLLHVESCPDCAAHVKSLPDPGLHEILPDDPVHATPPTTAADAPWAASESPGPSHRPLLSGLADVFRPLRTGFPRWMPALAAAALFLLALALWPPANQGPLPEPAPEQRPATRFMADLELMENADLFEEMEILEEMEWMIQSLEADRGAEEPG